VISIPDLILRPFYTSVLLFLSPQFGFDAFLYSVIQTLKLCFHTPSFSFVEQGLILKSFTFIHILLQLHAPHLNFTYFVTRRKQGCLLSRNTLLSVALVEARFGQENSVQGIIAAIGGNNGQAATLAGTFISTLLAGSDACGKLRLANQVAVLDGVGAVDAAKKLVQVEKNFNPFVVDRPIFVMTLRFLSLRHRRGSYLWVAPYLYVILMEES